MASSAQAGCRAPARAQSAGAILTATRVPTLRVVPGPAEPVGRNGVTRAPSLSTKTSTLPKHVATRQGRHKGAGKGTYTSCSEGGGPLRGGLPTPLSGA
eukprot:scaffold8961_cov124-Isochrysis_galbana.AAC.2